MKKKIDEFIALDKETSKLLGVNKYGKAWEEKEFLYDLKDKWKYSVYSTINNEVNGYLISSSYLNKIHAHRLALKTNLSPIQKLKITRFLYKKLETIAKNNQIESLSAIVPLANKSTSKFYKKDGWIELSTKEIDIFINERNMEAYSKHPNLLIDKYPNPNDPSVSFVLKYFYEY